MTDNVREDRVTPRTALIHLLDEGGYEWEDVHRAIDKVVEAEAASLDSDELRKAVEHIRLELVQDVDPDAIIAEIDALLSAGDKAATGCTMYGHKTPRADCVYCLGHAALAGDKAEAPPKTHDSDGGDRG